MMSISDVLSALLADPARAQVLFGMTTVVHGLFSITVTALTSLMLASQYNFERQRHKYERYERGEALYFSMQKGINLTFPIRDYSDHSWTFPANAS
jgi:hypothetical protein